MSIDPIQLPTAGGTVQAGGDVRHPAVTDELSAATISRATQNLAARDNILSEKLNQVIAGVNSIETSVALAVPPVRLPPLGSISGLYFRVPAGWQVRVVNATVASDQNDQVKLEVLWSPFFGQETGTTVVSTMGESAVATQAFDAGGITVRLVNMVGRSTTAKASVELALIGSSHAIVPPSGGSGGGGSGGTSGFSGASGHSGFSGAVGPRGSSGFSGASGLGLSGYSGASGVSGFSGTPGAGAATFDTHDVQVMVLPGGSNGDPTQNYAPGPPLVTFTQAMIAGTVITPLANYLQTGDVVTVSPVTQGQSLPSGLVSGKSYLVNRVVASMAMSLYDPTTGVIVSPGTGAGVDGVLVNDAYGLSVPAGSTAYPTLVTETRTISQGRFMACIDGKNRTRYTGRLILTLPAISNSPVAAYTDWTVYSTQVVATSDAPNQPTVFPMDTNKWIVFQPDPYNATKVDITLTGSTAGGILTPSPGTNLVVVQGQIDGTLNDLATTQTLLARIPLTLPAGKSWSHGRVVFTTRLNTQTGVAAAIENVVVKVGSTDMPWVRTARGMFDTNTSIDSSQFTAILEGPMTNLESVTSLVLDVYANRPAGTFVGDVKTLRRAIAVCFAS